MTPGDLARVQAMADRIHTAHPEDPEVLAERLALYPRGCLVLEAGGALFGYAFSHPWRALDAPPLNACLGALPARTDTYYLHDLALLPEARGRGLAAQAVSLLAERAIEAGMATVALVSIPGTGRFWEGLGFRRRAAPALAEKLLGYGPGATYMARDLTEKEDAGG